ncbi:proline-rich transmembrane protein 1-like isoform X1 [Octopus vulgaris]|uniref:Proline-rich transmembrane protein 1-like isoform X1 n=1 Tax=Octopus vulgaris TaxID=6645 RepID=A0AA36AP87_OCTVU|nr:proline-rich transmembrane protein 1-like isoform X1 [Octopus vulgaris]
MEIISVQREVCVFVVESEHPPPRPPVEQQPRREIIVITPEDEIPNRIGWALCVTICCFCPTGIAAIMYSILANAMAESGERDDALKANSKAGKFIGLSIFFGAIIYLIVIIVASTK